MWLPTILQRNFTKMAPASCNNNKWRITLNARTISKICYVLLILGFLGFCYNLVHALRTYKKGNDEERSESRKQLFRSFIMLCWLILNVFNFYRMRDVFRDVVNDEEQSENEKENELCL